MVDDARKNKFSLPGPIRALFAALIAAWMTGAGPPAAGQERVFSTIDDAINSVEEGFKSVWPDALTVEDVRARVGVGLGGVPDYQGSDNYRFVIVPLIDIRYRNRIRLVGTKLEVAAYNTEHWSLGGLINYNTNRSEDRNPALAGLGNVPGTFELGGFFEFAENGLLVRGEVRQSLSDNLGTKGLLTVAHGIYRDDKYTLVGAVQGAFASGNRVQRFFGITPEQAASSEAGLPVFRARAGLTSLSGFLLGTRYFYDDWRLNALFGLEGLTGDAANSPLVKLEGAAFQVFGGVGLRRDF